MSVNKQKKNKQVGRQRSETRLSAIHFLGAILRVPKTSKLYKRILSLIDQMSNLKFS